MARFPELGNWLQRLAVAGLAVSCGQEAAQQQAPQAAPVQEEAEPGIQDADLEKDAAKKIEVVPRVPCEAPTEASNLRSSIESVINLINALPRPVTIPCVIDVLPRPLKVNATSSALSVQPAEGLQNPRIFIELNSVILTFALTGEGSTTIEFSHILSDTMSIKGEIAFPVKDTLPITAAYDEIKRTTGTGTRCSGCHFSEAAAGGTFPDVAFVSKALRPFDKNDVSIDILQQLKDHCGNTRSERCDMLDALFRGGVPRRYSFPSAMPTLF